MIFKAQSLLNSSLMSEFDAGIASKVLPICQGNFQEIYLLVTYAELLD